MCKKEMVSWITFFKDYNKRIYEKLPDNLAVEKNLEAGDTEKVVWISPKFKRQAVTAE